MRANKTVTGLSSGLVTFIMVVITIAVLGVGSLTYGLVNKIASKLESAKNQVIATEYKEYEQGLKSGDTVINIIDAAERNPDHLEVTVTTLRSSTVDYGYSDYDDTTYVGYSVQDPAAVDYINPIGQFESAVVTSNGTVTGITFTQRN